MGIPRDVHDDIAFCNPRSVGFSDFGVGTAVVEDVLRLAHAGDYAVLFCDNKRARLPFGHYDRGRYVAARDVLFEIRYEFG